MSTPQEYWDACLIKTWRQYGSYLDAVNMFKSITGIDLYRPQNPRTILRTPKKSFPVFTGIRIFVAQFLPKISDRLHDQPPEKDVLLLRKLSSSKYDVEEKAYQTSADRVHKNAQKTFHKNTERINLQTTNIIERNKATDWNVVKGPVRVRRKK